MNIGFPVPSKDSKISKSLKSIQSGITITAAQTLTISPVDLNKTIICADRPFGMSSSTNSILPIIQLINSTTLSIASYSGGAPLAGVSWRVMQLRKVKAVYSGVFTLYGGMPIFCNITIPAVVVGNCTESHTYGVSDGDATLDSAIFTSSTNLRLIVNGSTGGATAKVAWFVVEWM